jgi:hypothetical protein
MMEKERKSYLKFTPLLVLALFINMVSANDGTIKINSHSFNAKKRSSFTIDGQTERIERGLTIVHFQSNKKFEFGTFDTHGSEEEAEKFMKIVERMNKNQARFAILAHDSAAKSLSEQRAKLKQMGFALLSTLKSREAYIMHNLTGTILEKVDSVSLSMAIKHLKVIADDEVYFPKIKYAFEPNNNRYIAHGGGEINGVKSTNSKEALDLNYKKGFRLFELDIIETSDGKMVAAHDWKMWSRFTDYKGSLPPSLAEFKKHKIYGDYHTLDLEGINKWFAAHPDAILVTDKINDPITFAGSFVDKDRLIMELFSPMAIEEATKNGIQAMISQQPLMRIVGDKMNYLLINDIKYVALSRRIIASKTKLMLKLKENGIKVYVYNVNFDPGKDEKYVQENEIGLVYGMYADKWVFDVQKKVLAK